MKKLTVALFMMLALATNVSAYADTVSAYPTNCPASPTYCNSINSTDPQFCNEFYCCALSGCIAQHEPFCNQISGFLHNMSDQMMKVSCEKQYNDPSCVTADCTTCVAQMEQFKNSCPISISLKNV